MAYSYSDEAVVDVNTNAQSLFEHLDDQARLALHMGERSMMMMVEYDLPASLFGWVAGRLFAPMYSRGAGSGWRRTPLAISLLD